MSALCLFAYSLKIAGFETEVEDKEYKACSNLLNGRSILGRMAKRTPKKAGQFVFPKSVLIKKGIMSTQSKEGKRAFRVYAKWDAVSNKQAERTQKWQLQYFYEVHTSTDLKKVVALYGF